MLRNCQALNEERAKLFSTIRQVRNEQLQYRALVSRQERGQRTLRLNGRRPERPAFGTYEYLFPIGR